jgi:hypothetical protein
VWRSELSEATLPEEVSCADTCSAVDDGDDDDMKMAGTAVLQSCGHVHAFAAGFA